MNSEQFFRLSREAVAIFSRLDSARKAKQFVAEVPSVKETVLRSEAVLGDPFVVPKGSASISFHKQEANSFRNSWFV